MKIFGIENSTMAKLSIKLKLQTGSFKLKLIDSTTTGLIPAESAKNVNELRLNALHHT